jgi:lysophospholipid acyltransferase (LPLAT)-like uncharacterized protein
MKSETPNKWLLRLAPLVVAWLLRIWFATCRVREHGLHFRRQVEPVRQAAIATFWHYSLFYVFYHLRKDPAAVLVSASRDGEYIARLAHHLNFATIRGSRNRRGMRALKELIAWIQKGGNVGIVADGSQGPALIAQPGAIMLASRTGAPILPLAWSASRYLRFKSWDRTAIPTPFATIDFYYGKPLWMPPKVTAAAVEPYRQELEASLNRLYRKAWRRYGQEAH